MKAEGPDCREWRPSLGAYALGHLEAGERAALEAHLDGCPACRAEAEALGSVAVLLPLADPARIERPAPKPPPELGERIAATIGEERRVQGRRRRQRRFALGFAGAGATALAAVLLVLVLLPGSGGGEPAQHVRFASLPANMHISATLEPHPYGTQIRMYVSGVRSGTVCRVFLRGPHGERISAGTFTYRYGADSEAVLSAALDLSSTEAIGVTAGKRTFVQRVAPDGATAIVNKRQEEPT